jgi:group I intron endonuclease
MIKVIPPSAGIYKITNIATGDKYIGSAVNLKKRYDFHVYQLQRGAHHNPRMQRAWNKYGADCFQFEPIEILDNPANLLAREQEYLTSLNVANKKDYYNICGVAGSNLGVKRSDTTKARMSAAQRGRTFKPETIEKMRQAKLGKALSDEHKKKIGASCAGKKINRALGIINTRLRKLSNEQVIEVRKMRTNGASWCELSNAFNMGKSAVRRVALGLVYKDVVAA